ncbi:MAG: helix-turn-helix domain-containing protein [Erysipelotrichaceae bacterium]|nr:helix-turn-helix domain-containing protein [Erysipelotrichaceae bacterium]
MDVLKIRKSLGMTQAEFAEAIGVDKSVVYKYEHGILNPPKKRRERIDFIASLGGKDSSLIEMEYSDEEAVKDRVTDGIIRRLMIIGANGCCELCGSKAPFLDKNKRPYLCLYITDNDKKKDVTRRCVALCPNCLARINVLADENEINTLKNKADQHNY